MKKLLLPLFWLASFTISGQIAESAQSSVKIPVKKEFRTSTLTVSCNLRTRDTIKDRRARLTALYLSLGSDLGYSDFFPRAGIAGSFILANNWGGSISMKTAMFRARNLPLDYRPGGFFLFGDGIPDDGMTMISLCVMREFPSRSKMVRFGLEGGPSLVGYDEVYFTPNEYSGPTLFGPPSNYSSDYVTKKTAGLALRAKIEFPLTRYAGCEFAVNSNLNMLRPFIGAEIHLTLGVVRGRQIARM
jgi:hypothetical protein